VSGAKATPGAGAKEPRTLDAEAREAGFRHGATKQPGAVMLAGFAGTNVEAMEAAAQVAARGNIQAERYRVMCGVDGMTITIRTGKGE
jgi:hypothetical protein